MSRIDNLVFRKQLNFCAMPGGSGCRVFLGNLPSDVRISDIEKFFKDFGRVRNVLIKNGKYAFAEFDDYRDADDAVYDLNGRVLMGERITVEHAKGPRRVKDDRRAPWVNKYGAPQRTNHRLRIENLSSRVSWQDVKDLLRKGGEVTFVEAHTDRRNEGLVEFATREDLERVYKRYDDHELNGRRIKLIRERNYSKSRSRSKSRSTRPRKESRSPSSRKRTRSKSRKSRSRSERRGSRGSKSGSRSPGGRSSPDKDEEEWMTMDAVDDDDKDVKRTRRRSGEAAGGGGGGSHSKEASPQHVTDNHSQPDQD